MDSTRRGREEHFEFVQNRRPFKSNEKKLIKQIVGFIFLKKFFKFAFRLVVRVFVSSIGAFFSRRLAIVISKWMTLGERPLANHQTHRRPDRVRCSVHLHYRWFNRQFGWRPLPAKFPHWTKFRNNCTALDPTVNRWFKQCSRKSIIFVRPEILGG